MHRGQLRKVGGSVMVAIPPVLLELLEVEAGTVVGLSLEEGRLILTPAPRPQYRLEELLSRCDAGAAPSEEDREWLDAPAAGQELL